jgi:hypothetical protein
MLDYTKFLIKNIAIADLMSNEALDFEGVFSASSSEVKKFENLHKSNIRQLELFS